MNPGEDPATRPSHDCDDPIHREATPREQLMTGLALVFLVFAALTLHRVEGAPEDTGYLPGTLLLALWVPLGIDALVGFARRGDFSRPATQRLLLLLAIPPFRIALSPYGAESCVFLPMLGWQRADVDLYERMERTFGIPMLFMAVLILPILAVELFWADLVSEHPGIRLFLDVGALAIWIAFCIEFIVMVTLAPKKLVYMARNWINLAIIVLPFLAFLRGLRGARLLWLGKGLGKAAKALKVYRLRGLGLRGWRGMVALDLVERLLHRTPERRLKRLREILGEREREMARLRERIQDLEAQVGAEKERGDDPD